MALFSQAQLLLLLGPLGRLLFKMKTVALNRSTVSFNREMKEQGWEVSIKTLLWVFFKALTEVWSATFNGKRDRKDRKWCNIGLKWSQRLPLNPLLSKTLISILYDHHHLKDALRSKCFHNRGLFIQFFKSVTCIYTCIKRGGPMSNLSIYHFLDGWMDG